jgi:ferredoxin-thioredoxin reductase catalytic subunit
VKTQRKIYLDNKLDKDRIKRLDDIGFVWNQLDSDWEDKFELLRDYKRNHGNCNVPLRWEVNDFKIGTWVSIQRKSYLNNKLDNDRIKCLEDIGFVWSPIDSYWQEMFEALIEYKKEHGDCNVPARLLKNKQLANWVTVQRKNYKKGQIDEDRIRLLEVIGFVWNPLESKWEEMFEALVEYKKESGEYNVPKGREENKQLATWAQNQRSDYQKGKLDKERIKRLEVIGFVWNPLESKWEEMFEALVEYKKEHGDCNVPKRWEENKLLATWVQNQRSGYKKGQIDEDKSKKLDDIGFVWNALEFKWEEMFEALIEYKKGHGDCNVPLEWAENKKLGGWVGTQRKSYLSNIISNDRIKRLENIGFEWNILK